MPHYNYRQISIVTMKNTEYPDIDSCLLVFLVYFGKYIFQGVLCPLFTHQQYQRQAVDLTV